MLTAGTVRALAVTALQALDKGDLPSVRLLLGHLATAAAEHPVPAGPVTGAGPLPIAPAVTPPGSVHSLEAVTLAAPIANPAYTLEGLPGRTRFNETATLWRTP